MATTIRKVFAVAVILHPWFTEAFSYSTCNKTIQRLVAENETFSQDPEIFYGDRIDRKNLELRYSQCKIICETGQTSVVRDCGPRLTAWVLPIVILIGSMQLPPLAWRHKLWAILRLAGDPFGSLMWMIDELAFYEVCLDEGARAAMAIRRNTAELDERNHLHLTGSFARIIHAFSKTRSGQRPKITQFAIQRAIDYMGRLDDSGVSLGQFCDLVKDTGEALLLLKSRSMFKSFHAIFWFLVPVVLAIIPQVAQSVASGGMMISILILSPLLLMIFLSNTLGEYSNLRLVCHHLNRVMSIVPEEIRHDLGVNLSLDTQPEIADLLGYTHDALGLSPGWTSEKEILRRRTKRRITRAVLVFVFPLAIASTCVAIATRPAYFQERHFVIITIFIAWTFSWLVTRSVLKKYSVENDGIGGVARSSLGKDFAWFFVAATHSAVAVSVPIFLAGMTCGWLGGCKMWSGYFRYGPEKARMPLNLGPVFERNATVLYPGLASVCLGLNVGAFFVLRYLVFRRAFRVIAGKDDRIG